MNLREAARAFYRRFDDLSTVDIVTRLTLIAILVSDHVAGADWYVKASLRSLAVVGILIPPLHKSWVLWLFATLVFAFRATDDWWFQDNHLFVFTYWSLALCLALRLAAPDAALAKCARLLLGLSFAFATLWKGFLSPDFMDGTYFHFTILADPRFQGVGTMIGRVPIEAYVTNFELLESLGRWKPDTESVTLISTQYMPILALVLTWWTVVIEGLMGLGFLWPGAAGPARIRNWVLILFGATTYTVATVPTFGWILMTLGAAQCEPDERLPRFLYAALCLAILLFSYAKVLSLILPFVPSPSLL